MSNPFTHENHLAFIAERRRMEEERTNGNLITLDEALPVRALRLMIQLQKKFKNDMAKVRATMVPEQYALAENEFISRAGDPNRFNAETGGWIIWP